MKWTLILYCAIYFNYTKSSPVFDSVFALYFPKSLPSYMTKIDDDHENKGHAAESNSFDAVRKHYEIDNAAADESFEYSAVTVKFSNSLVFNKAKYTKTVENEIQYEYDGDITTKVSYISLGDLYLDIQDSPTNDNRNVGIDERYISDVHSEIRNDKKSYKSQRDNEFKSEDDDLNMSNRNVPNLLAEKGNKMLPVPSSGLKKPRRIELTLKNNRIDIIQ